MTVPIMDTGVPRREGRTADAFLDRGRVGQKRRTRDALVDAARRELARGHAVTVESVAAVAGISRTTAYRYFANHRELVAAAHPQIDLTSLVPDPASSDPAERLGVVMHAFIHDVTLAWEPQLRAALQLALTPPGRTGADVSGAGSADASTLRKGRGIGWILHALQPMHDTHPHVNLQLLARAIRSAAGIEALIWLTDVGGLPRQTAAQVMHASAMAILDDALRHTIWPPDPQDPDRQ